MPTVRRATSALALLLAAVLTGGCGSSPAPLLRADPQTYLVGLDQLPSPGFTVVRGPAQVSPDDVLPGQGAVIAKAGFQAAASVTFFRQDASLLTTNGPIEIISTVLRMATADDAATAFPAARRYVDGLAGATPVSTGELGDEAHAVSRVVDDNGYRAVEIDIVWRYLNALNVLVIRGRYGGARIDDAVAIAHQQASNEVGGGAPGPVVTATPAPSASGTAPASASPIPEPTLAP